MSEKQLKNKIQYFEDMLLRSKNVYEIERLQRALFDLRVDLQKLQWNNQKSRGLL